MFIYLKDLPDKRAGEVGACLTGDAVLFPDKLGEVVDGVRHLMRDGVKYFGGCLPDLREIKRQDDDARLTVTDLVCLRAASVQRACLERDVVVFEDLLEYLVVKAHLYHVRIKAYVQFVVVVLFRFH